MTLARNGKILPSLQARAFNTDQLSVISAKKTFEGLRPFEKALLIWRSWGFCPKVRPSMIRGLLETTFQLVSQMVKR